MKAHIYSALVLALNLVACTRHRNVVDNIAQQLRSGATRIDMARATDFAWDEVYVFNPYYPKDDICRTLKIDLPRCSRAGVTDVDEGEFLLVFTQNSEISQVVRFPRAIADFEESEKCIAKGIARNAAIFSVRDEPKLLVCQ